MSELPPGWTVATVDDVTQPFVSIDPRSEPTRRFAYIDIGSIDNESQTIADPKTFAGADAPSRARRVVHQGDVLFSTVRTYLKNIALVPPALDGALTSTGIAVLRASGAVDPKYLFSWVCSAPFIDNMSKSQDGTMYPAVSDKDVAAAEIALPPLAEQRRIVAKLDQVMARTARARTELARIPALIAQHKRSLYMAAFSGQWARSEWRWERAGAVCDRVQSGGTPREGFVDNGVPFLKVYNVVDQQVDFAYRPQFVTNNVHTHALRKSIARPGDVLMNIVGPPLGKVAVVPNTHPEWNINQALTLFRPNDRVSTAWLYHFLCSGIPVRSVINETRGMVGQVNISLSQCRAFELPVPPPEEQREIVRRIESAFAWLDKVAHEHAQATRLLDHLDQALLAKAFRGELVPQDPADEPAAALLACIRAEREDAAPPRKRKARG